MATKCIPGGIGGQRGSACIAREGLREEEGGMWGCY